MKTLFKILPILYLVSILPSQAHSQCGAGYTSAQLNWDHLDYYFNSGIAIAPYGRTGGNYVTDAMERAQTFGIGTTEVRFDVSAAGVVKGENATHTGNIANFTGEDAYFTPTANGQIITLTFDAEVTNASFTLYDLDNLANFSFAARNTATTLQSITATTQAGTILVVGGTPTARTVSTASGSNLANTSNNGTVTLTVAGPVKTITITITNRGGNPEFWMSDINACVSGSFPANWHQAMSPRPFTNSPDYFISTPSNNGVYMIDPATARASFLFSDVDPDANYVNSLAYDPVRHLLYYVLDESSASENNKILKAYDFNTDTKITILADLSAALGIPTYDVGVESAAAAFYNGFLYLGIEGSRMNATTTRESIVYKLTLDAAGIPIKAAQVFSINSYGATNEEFNNWGDFLVFNGNLINWNVARRGTGPYTYPDASYIHYNMMTGTVTNTYMNPGTGVFAGQAGLDWAGNTYTVRNVLQRYNMAGGVTSTMMFSTLRGPNWTGAAGDASEPFRPKVDFGDAPVSYDPVEIDAAVHEMDSAIILGPGFDREWVTRGQTALANSDNFDDALSYVPVYNPIVGAYIAPINVFNNTGADATVCAWLDADGDGVFETSEGMSMTIPTNPATQTAWIYIPGLPATLGNGVYTYLRIRITRATEGMTTANARGWYRSGEVEDFRVPVNDFALAEKQFDFTAELTPVNSVKLDWEISEETGTSAYVVERSKNGSTWEMVKGVTAKNSDGLNHYEVVDNTPINGIIHYRLKILNNDGSMKLSPVRTVENRVQKFSVSVAPNPASSSAMVYISSNTLTTEPATLEVINAQGAVVYKEKINLKPGTNAVRLPVENGLASGRYLIRVITNLNAYTQTLIIKK